jgi:alpha-tubulin suppressor-like RCC1 family protein
MSLDHMCGVATDGNAFCWGGNDMGELGNRTTTPSTTPVRVKLFAP